MQGGADGKVILSPAEGRTREKGGPSSWTRTPNRCAEETVPGIRGIGRVSRIFSRRIYRALRAEHIRHRRTASTDVLMRLLLSLDYVIEHPDLPWLPRGRFTLDRTPGRFEAAMSERTDAVIQKLIDIGSEIGKMAVQVAIAWILDHPEITSPILGPDTIEHFDEACGALGWHLDPEHRAELDEASAVAPQTLTA